jgi:hypothetical protein
MTFAELPHSGGTKLFAPWPRMLSRRREHRLPRTLVVSVEDCPCARAWLFLFAAKNSENSEPAICKSSGEVPSAGREALAAAVRCR